MQSASLAPSPIATPSAIDRLWLPRLSLTACVRAVMSRNTIGVALSDAQRFNYFPATPLCSVSWWFAGESLCLPFNPSATTDGERTPMPGSIVFAGPHNQPSLSWNPGACHGMMVMLMPDALQALTGILPNEYLNQLVDARTVLPASWMEMCQSVQAAPDDDGRVALIEDFLDPLWQAARPGQALRSQRYEDWTHGLALRAATSGLGRSLRQVERRIKLWSGQPLRDLRGVSRAERAFFQAMADADGSLSLAELATQAGYADQSHMCRESRRVTGFPPEELWRRIASDEAFWAYRLWQ
jgi:AraC-like DNA-binding protein